MSRAAHLLLVAATLLAALAAPAARAATPLTPTPADWRDVVIYQLLTDRFWNGNPANDAVEGAYDPAAGDRIHGGDFAGVEAKLEYIQQLGATAVWISPVVLNANAEYHGYAARDFFAIAPHFGTMAELRSMVDAAHARGISVILDVVVNHMGDLIDSGDPGWPTFQYPGTYTLRWTNPAKRHAGFFDDLSRFHAHGAIGNSTDPEQILGELFSLDDLKTEDAAVRDQLIEAAAWLIDSTDCDGFRLDTAKHVDMPFWDTWAPAVHAHAASRGKDTFFLYGEAFDGSDTKVGSYTGTQSGGNYKFDSMLYFPMYFTASSVFRSEFGGPSSISQRYAALDQYDPTARERLVTFLDNHDVARFLGFAGPADNDEAKLRAALGWLLTARGVPAIYYGTEQAFDGGGDPYNREDMWDGAWDFGPSDGDNFDPVRPLYHWTRRLIAARSRHEALRRGTTSEIFASGFAGLYVYSRESANDTVLVAVNTSNAPQVHALAGFDWPPGTIVCDAVTPGLRDTVDGGSVLTLWVPARGVRVYESLASRTAASAADRLVLESSFPGHDQWLADRWSPLRLVFDREVPVNAVTQAFSISPPTPGIWQVQGREGIFHPLAPWGAGEVFAWSLDSSLVAADGTKLAGTIRSFFQTIPVASGVTVPGGYVADRITGQMLRACEAVVPAPALGPGTLLVSDTGRDALFTLTAGGDVGHWLGDSRWLRALGVAPSPSGGITVVDGSGVYEIDSRRIPTMTVGGSTTAAAGGLAWGAAAFSNRLHLSDPGGNRVRQLNGASYVTLATGINGPQGLVFGPGGAWGTDLYVADPNLTAIGASTVDGARRIARVSAAGAVTTFASDASLLGGVTALAFDTGGRFGGHLYGADVVNERIVQITPAGAVSVFASGFRNLVGPNCLTFAADGSMIVVDAGQGQTFSWNGVQLPAQIIRLARSELSLDAPPPAAPAAAAVALPVPNPSHGAVSLRFTLPLAGDVALDVFDVSGRRVRSLARGTLAAGEHTRAWNGRDASGRMTPAGLYLARLTSGGHTVTQRIVRMR